MTGAQARDDRSTWRRVRNASKIVARSRDQGLHAGAEEKPLARTHAGCQKAACVAVLRGRAKGVRGG